MTSKKDVLQVLKYSDLILEIIDEQEVYTRSDLQGVVEAIVIKIITETRKEAKI